MAGNKRRAHGGQERREIWVVESPELGAYLEREYGWPGLWSCGRIRRWRRKLSDHEWGQEDVIWIAERAMSGLSRKQARQALRGPTVRRELELLLLPFGVEL